MLNGGRPLVNIARWSSRCMRVGYRQWFLAFTVHSKMYVLHEAVHRQSLRTGRGAEGYSVLCSNIHRSLYFIPTTEGRVLCFVRSSFGCTTLISWQSEANFSHGPPELRSVWVRRVLLVLFLIFRVLENTPDAR